LTDIIADQSLVCQDLDFASQIEVIEILPIKLRLVERGLDRVLMTYPRLHELSYHAEFTPPPLFPEKKFTLLAKGLECVRLHAPLDPFAVNEKSLKLAESQLELLYDRVVPVVKDQITQDWLPKLKARGCALEWV
jgi:hypothetical protein